MNSISLFIITKTNFNRNLKLCEICKSMFGVIKGYSILTIDIGHAHNFDFWQDTVAHMDDIDSAVCTYSSIPPEFIVNVKNLKTT